MNMMIDQIPFQPADIDRLLLIGLTPDEIWCAIVEPGPWAKSQTSKQILKKVINRESVA